MNLRRTVLVAVVAAATIAPAPAADENRVDAVVQRLTMRLGRRSDSCRLRLQLPLDPYLDTLDVPQAVIAVDIGPTRVFEMPAANARGRLRETATALWKYRQGRRGPRFALDIAHHSVNLRLRRADLDGVADVANAGVRVAVTLGDRVYEHIVDLDRMSRRLALAAPRPVFGGPNDGSIEDDAGGGGSVGGPVSANVLDQGWSSGIFATKNVVVRTAGEFTALWAQHQFSVSPPATQPAVDFGTQMVVAVFLGNRPSPADSVELRGVTSDGATTTVSFTDARITSGDCAFATVVTQPYIFVAVPKTPAVTFAIRIEQRSCP